MAQLHSPTHEDALRGALAWWLEAGVDSAEAEAILSAPTPKALAPQRQDASAPIVKKAVRPLAANPAESARAAAAKATTLAELGQVITAFDGCALKQTARNTVFCDGVAGAPVLVIGEAPGRDEDAAGKPFVGRSGQLLDRMLSAIGLSRQENVFITNVIYWRPPGNRPPTQGEIATCLPFVERTIALARPKLIVLAGGVAAQAVAKRAEGVTRLSGKRISVDSAGLTEKFHAMVMLHPAYLLRRPQEKSRAWRDLQALETWAEEIGLTVSRRL
jgi:DNA polymerase